jgi:hypothetical protein
VRPHDDELHAGLLERDEQLLEVVVPRGRAHVPRPPRRITRPGMFSRV